MKHILFLTADLCSRGAEKQMVTVACLLKQAGYDVSFLCYHTNNFFEYLLKDYDIPVKWLHLPNYLQRMLKIRNYIRKGNYDVVISFLQTDNFLNDFAAIGRHNWKVITGERSSKEILLTSYKGRLFGLFQRRSDFIVCNSENARRMWIKHYPQYNGKLKVIYNNVKTTLITTDYIIRKDDKTHFLVAGAYSFVKDPQCLIEALTLLSEEDRQKISIDWFGKVGINEEANKIYEDCKSLISKNNLGSIIFLRDAISDIGNKMNEADVVALFSKWEGLPNSICEGMMLGKPIIMTRISDYSVLVDDSNGYLCDIHSPSSIKAALEAIIRTTNETLLSQGAHSKEKAKQLFSDEVIYKCWSKLIE